jgi:hypothetical protein
MGLEILLGIFILGILAVFLLTTAIKIAAILFLAGIMSLSAAAILWFFKED